MTRNKKPTIEAKYDLKRLNAFAEFADEFSNESDRAAVILGVAKLDHILYQILSMYLLPKAGSKDELLDGDSPLSTFSSKINLCFRLGIIDADFARALHIIRKVRNTFAHEVSGCNLELAPHKDRVAELIAPVSQNYYFDLYKQLFFGEKPEVASNFKTALGLCVARLEGITRRVKPLTEQNVTKFIKHHSGPKIDIKGFIKELRSSSNNLKTGRLIRAKSKKATKAAGKKRKEK